MKLLKDASVRASSGGLMDLVNILGWKGSGILILIIIIGYIVVSVFFN
jgi:hypothetical protein